MPAPPESDVLHPEGHLALVIPDLSGGGAERVAVVLANEAAARGLKVSLLVLRADGPLAGIVSGTVDVAVLGVRSARQCVLPLRRWLRKAQPQAVMVTPSHLGWAACVATLGMQRPPEVFIREASTLSVDLAEMGVGARLARLAAERLLARDARRIALCRYCAEDLSRTLRLRPESITVIPNPVIGHERAYPASDRRESDVPVLLAAGRLVRQKGFDTLIRALASLRRVRPARLLIAGEGPERDRLIRLAKELQCLDAIEFTGFVQDLPSLMASADAFVLPSRWEGLPGILIEALALGLPVVATDSPGGAREILEDGRWGELVPVDAPGALARAIIDALDSPRPRPDGAWFDRYSVDAAVSEYLQVMGFSLPLGE